MPLTDTQLKNVQELLAGSPTNPRGLGLLTGELSRRIGQAQSLIGQIHVDYSEDPPTIEHIEDGIHQAITEAEALAVLRAIKERALATAQDIMDLLS